MITKYILVVLAIILRISEGQACQCYPLYFCEYLYESSKKVVIEGTVLRHVSYSKDDAVYLKVDQVFRDDVGISGIIKLYGQPETGDCHVDVLKRFPDGSKVYVAIGLEFNGQPVSHSFTNPDALYEDYWEIAPFSCFMALLNVKNGIVSGRIIPQVFEYPLDVFEQHIETCNYSIEDLNISRCNQLPFKIFPNPSSDGTFHIANEYRYTSIKRIRIFDVSGRIIYDQTLEPDTFQKASFHLPHSGLYILEFQCQEAAFFEKVIVE